MKTDLTLKQAADELGFSYGYFRQIYTKFLTDNGIKIRKYPPAKRTVKNPKREKSNVRIDRKSFEFFREASVIN